LGRSRRDARRQTRGGGTAWCEGDDLRGGRLRFTFWPSTFFSSR
jgi:hypothetical protein